MTVTELKQSDQFELIGTVDHDAIHAWVRPYLFSISPVTIAYWTLNCCVIGWVVLAWSGVNKGIIDTFSILALGMCSGWILLLPVHEYVHAIAYRATGASDARVVYTLRRLTALCIAPGHVVSGRQFAFVALAPFVVLNSALAIAAFAALPGVFTMVLLGALLIHVGACSGDIAFVQYVWLHRSDELYTYDDSRTPQTYFYRRKRAQGAVYGKLSCR